MLETGFSSLTFPLLLLLFEIKYHTVAFTCMFPKWIRPEQGGLYRPPRYIELLDNVLSLDLKTAPRNCLHNADFTLPPK